MKPKISLITLGVSDFQRSLRFYRDGLKFTPHQYKEGDEHVMFQLEGTWLALFPKKELAKDAGVSASSHGFSGITLAQNLASPKKVDNAYQEAIKAGATPMKQQQKVFWGGYSGYFADPDGYLWELAFNPFTDLT